MLGTVLDPNKSSVPQARVSLLNVDTGVVQNVQADANGTYQFLEVHVGTYRATAEAPGFKRGEIAEFRVGTAARQRVDIALQVGDTTQTVQVASTATILQTESSERGQVISREEIVNFAFKWALDGFVSVTYAGCASGARPAEA